MGCYIGMDKNIIDLFDLSGRTVVVTGGGDGIGRGCCEILAAAGANVVVSNRTLWKAETVADEIKAKGGNAAALMCDVTAGETALRQLIDDAAEIFGTVNILINNAGGGGGGKEDPWHIDLDYVERIYMMNLFAPWVLSKYAAIYMERSGYGSIVNITSMSSINADPCMSIYGSSKAALNHLCANMAYDLGPKGIRINCVGPGAVRTKALASVLTPEIEARMLSHTPIRRLGEVDDIARAVLFLASPASSWISGQTLMVNGGGVQTLD